MRHAWILLLVATCLAACENQENKFPDYDYNAVYFPFQFPVRTLSLGIDDIDNSLDRELKFHIGVSIGGMYKNNQNWVVGYKVDESLCENLGDDVKALPAEYYTLDPANEVTISVGSFSGLILVQLTQDFLTDTLSIGNHYVIPLRITYTDADSILSGLPAVPDPDKRVASDWDASAPAKDFTLFMVKYVNEYHGKYLRRGVDYSQNAFGEITDTAEYREKYVELDQVVSMVTDGRYILRTNFSGVYTGDEYAVMLTIDPGSGEVLVETADGAKYKVIRTVSGSFVPGGDSWGGRDRDVFYLDYLYRVGINSHHVYDTLVFRDRGIAFEQFVPNIL